jgi:MFS family permease
VPSLSLLDTTPLRVSPAFRRLYLGLAVSNIGGQVTVVAVGLQVYALTQSTAAVGILGLFALVPLVIFGLYGGAIADHYDRRRVALVASLVSWAAVLALVVQAAAGNEHVGVLYGLVALQSAAGAVNSPARGAIIPRLLDPRQMPAANALQTLAMNVSMTGGPLIGAVLVATVDYAVAYGLDAALFTLALVALWRLPAIPPEGGRPPGRAGLASVLDGLRYLGTRPNVRMTFLADIVAMVTSSPRVLFPAVGVLFLGGGATTTGAMTAAVATGGILAGLLSGGLSRVRWQGRAIVWSITVWGVAILGFGAVLVVAGAGRPDHVLWPLLIAAMVALAVAGAGDAVSGVFRQTILQTATPDEMRGRLQGVFIVVVAGGPRLGEAWLGGAASRIGEGWAAVLGGVLCVVVLWLLVVVQRTFWHYDARDPQP